jgi:hypothetical protein
MRNHAIAQRQQVPIMPSTGEGLVRARMRPVAVVVRRAVDLVMDVLILLAMILSIPFVILAVGIPVALGAQLLLWIGRLL